MNSFIRVGGGMGNVGWSDSVLRFASACFLQTFSGSFWVKFGKSVEAPKRFGQASKKSVEASKRCDQLSKKSVEASSVFGILYSRNSIISY